MASPAAGFNHGYSGAAPPGLPAKQPGAPFVFTCKVRDFAGSESLGVRALTPAAFLQLLFSP